VPVSVGGFRGAGPQVAPGAAADVRRLQTGGLGRADVVDGVVADVHDPLGRTSGHGDDTLEEPALRLGDAPLVGSGDLIGRQVELAEKLRGPRGLVSRDAHADPSRSEGREGGAHVRVEVGLFDALAATGGFTGFIFGGDVDAGFEEADGVGVVAALGDDGANQGGEGVTGHVQPVCPGSPVTVVAHQSLADVEHDRLNHAGQGIAESSGRTEEDSRVIEAELKARVEDPEVVMAGLEKRASARVEVYQDAYYDLPDGSLMGGDRELRVRTVHGPDSTRSVLTYKGARVDEESGSKPEHETAVEDPAAVHAMLRGLGYVPAIAFEKRCRNYEFEAAGRRMFATLVRVPEIDGTFIEVETLVEEHELQAALDDVHAVLAELGIGEDALTTEAYTDTVAARRAA
jgi:adenylate cyclase, class 2